MTLGDLDPWSLTANAGDNITLRVGTSGFPPSLNLFGPDGALLDSSNATSSGQRDLALAWRATNSGTFTVLVSSAYLGYSGSYTLDVFKVPVPLWYLRVMRGAP